MLSGKKRKFCEHCQEYLLIPTFKKHQDLYFDPVSKQWTGKEQLVPSAPDAKDVYDEKTIEGRWVNFKWELMQ